MKKIILWALALLAASATTVAQNNTFHMVITLTNGTTIALGPNEISHLTFNEGEVTVDGQALDIFMQQKAKTDSLSMVTSNLEDAVKRNLYQVITDIEQLQAQLNELKARVADMDPTTTSTNSEEMAEMKTRIAQIQSTLALLQTEMANVKSELKDEIAIGQAAQKSQIAQLQQQMEYLKKSLAEQEMQAKASDDELRQQITSLYNRLIALEAAVAELRN